jgi:hypothetical protein
MLKNIVSLDEKKLHVSKRKIRGFSHSLPSADAPSLPTRLLALTSGRRSIARLTVRPSVRQAVRPCSTIAARRGAGNPRAFASRQMTSRDDGLSPQSDEREIRKSERERETHTHRGTHHTGTRERKTLTFPV